MAAMVGPVAMAAMVLAKPFEPRVIRSYWICLAPMVRMAAMVKTPNGYAVDGSPVTNAMICKQPMAAMAAMAVMAGAAAMAVP